MCLVYSAKLTVMLLCLCNNAGLVLLVFKQKNCPSYCSCVQSNYAVGELCAETVDKTMLFYAGVDKIGCNAMLQFAGVGRHRHSNISGLPCVAAAAEQCRDGVAALRNTASSCELNRAVIQSRFVTLSAGGQATREIPGSDACGRQFVFFTKTTVTCSCTVTDVSRSTLRSTFCVMVKRVPVWIRQLLSTLSLLGDFFLLRIN